MGIADSQPVNKVRKALRDAGLDDRVVELDRPAAEDTAAAAKALECDPGAVALTNILSNFSLLATPEMGRIQANRNPGPSIA